MRLRLPTLQSLGWRRSTLPALFGADLRALGPVHVCTCGCTMFNIMAAFEDYDIAWWHLDGTCANCGNLVTIPCPGQSRRTLIYTACINHKLLWTNYQT
jgi:hypothetical protein